MSDGWATSMWDAGAASDEEEEMLPLVITQTMDPVISEPTVPKQFIDSAPDDETCYYASDDLLDIGQIEESCSFVQNPFSIAKAGAQLRKSQPSEAPAVLPPIAKPLRQVAKAAPVNNPIMQGFKRQAELAQKKSVKKAHDNPKSSKKKKKHHGPVCDSHVYSSPLQKEVVLLSSDPSVMEDVAGSEPGTALAQKFVHQDAISLLSSAEDHKPACHEPFSINPSPIALVQAEPDPVIEISSITPRKIALAFKKGHQPAPAYSNQSPVTPIKKRTAALPFPSTKGNKLDFSTLDIKLPPSNRYVGVESMTIINAQKPNRTSTFTLPGLTSTLLKPKANNVFRPPTDYETFKRLQSPSSDDEGNPNRPKKRIRIQTANSGRFFEPFVHMDSKDSDFVSMADQLEETVHQEEAQRMRDSLGMSEMASGRGEGVECEKTTRSRGSVFRFHDF